MLKLFTSFILVFLSAAATGQEEKALTISFQPFIENDVLVLGSGEEPAADVLEVETLRFYVSHLSLYKDEDLVFREENSFRLLDAENPSSFVIELPVPASEDFTHIGFSLGVDSLTSVSGAFGGDLDPTKGMYWAWQSGYINFKLEGTSPDCPARHNRFLFHLGGYQAPFNTFRTIRLKVKTKKSFTVKMDLDKFLTALDLKETYRVMSPSETGVHLAEVLTEIFSVL